MTEDSYYWSEAGLRSVLKVLLFESAGAKGGRNRRMRGKHIQEQFKVY